MTPEIRAASKLSKEEWREFTKTVWHIANVSHPDHPAVFPPEIPRRLIKLFSFVGDAVLDPFAGVGTTAKVAIDLDRTAISIEQNERYAEIIRTSISSAASSVFVRDSRDMSMIQDESVGLVVTSPPYWNKADYGPGESNLGNIGSYPRFFAEIRPVFEECLRVLKPGRKLCIVTANVNQHTDHGLLTFPLAADFTVLLREIGLVLINELIWSKDRTGGRWGSAGNQRPIFGSYPYPPNFLFKNVHEYILVFAKVPAKATTGRGAMNYRQLMSEWEGIEPEKSIRQTNGGNGKNGTHISNRKDPA